MSLISIARCFLTSTPRVSLIIRITAHHSNHVRRVKLFRVDTGLPTRFNLLVRSWQYCSWNCIIFRAFTRANRRLNDACTRARLKPIEGTRSGGSWQVMQSTTGNAYSCVQHGGASLIFERAGRLTYNGMCRDYKL